MNDRVDDTARRRILGAGACALLLGAPHARAEFMDWPQASAHSHGFDPAALDGVLEDAGAVPRMRAIAVARHGHLVAQRYYGGAVAGQPLRINSCTKSVVALLVGQALSQGKLRDLSQPVGDLLPEAAARVPDSVASHVTLRQILTGTSGIEYDYQRDLGALSGAADPVDHVLRLPRSEQAAGRWSYNDAAISLLTPILERAYGEELRQVAQRDLAAPMAVSGVRWASDRTGRATAAAGLQLRVLDLLKIAWLMIDQGRWRGSQVVPAAWIAECLQPHAPGAWPLPPIEGSSYGYLWFTGSLRGRRVAWAWGFGGQFAFLVPSLRLAVATAAAEPPMPELVRQTRDVMALVARVADAAA